MDLKILDTQKDDDLRAVITYSTDLLAKRDAERKATAMEKARELLAAAGLTLKDLTTKRATKKAPATFKPKADHVYQHPDNPALKANGTGVKPKWWNDLIASGKQPVDMGPVRKEAA